MNKLDNRFKTLKENGRSALITYFPIGEPGIDMLHLAEAYVSSGVDVLEIGLPVANPYLDGKTIGESMGRIKQSGFKPEKAFELIKEIHVNYPDIPLEIMCYKQLFDEIPLEAFSRLCNNSDIDALLVADASFDDQEYIRKNLGNNIHCLSFLPFQANQDYIDYLSMHSKGYIFLQAMDGKTGAQDQLDPKIECKIKAAKEMITRTPICAGFGISNAKQCAEVKRMGADGVIIGSAAVSQLKSAGIEKCAMFLKECKNSL